MSVAFKTPITFLDEACIRSLMTMADALELVEAAFAADAEKSVTTFPVVKDFIPPKQGSFVIKAGYMCVRDGGSDGERRTVLGLKAGSYWPANLEGGLPNHNAAMMMFDPLSGRPTAVLGANAITALRTAAGGAIAARHLARSSEVVVAMLGAGEQAYVQLEALQLVRKISEVRVWSRSPASAERYSTYWREEGLAVRRVASAEVAVRGADIIVTTTPARSPIVESRWVGPGAHINAIGSDAPGKVELAPDLVLRGRLIADKRTQSVTIGEMQTVIERGLADETHISAELGEICAGLKPGRTDDVAVTIFDSSGVSFQDLVLADYLVRAAQETGLGTVFNL
jgi:ornithine cyclodeaminase/alanine dehydrogenase-like protein (mu-crystallin family)